MTMRVKIFYILIENNSRYNSKYFSEVPQLLSHCKVAEIERSFKYSILMLIFRAFKKSLSDVILSRRAIAYMNTRYHVFKDRLQIFLLMLSH